MILIIRPVADNSYLHSPQDFLCLNMVNWVLQLSQGMLTSELQFRMSH